MADSNVVITQGSGTNIDTRTESTNSNHRQVIIVGHPSVNDAVAEVASLDVGASSTAYGQVVRLAGSAQVNIVAAGTGVTLGVNLGKVDGTIQTNIGKIDDTVSVKFASVAGTAGVNLGKVDGTIQTNIGKIDDVVSVRFNTIGGTAGVNLGKQDGTINVNVGKISDTIAVFLTGTAGSLIVKLAPGTGISNITNSVAIYFDRGNPAVDTELPAAAALGDNDANPTTPTVGAALMAFDGTNWDRVRSSSGDGAGATGLMQPLPMVYNGSTHDRLRGTTGGVFANIYATASIFTVSGSTSGVSASGVTLVAPSSAYNFKIFAYSLQTTIASSVFTFTNGAGTPTELWRPLITAVETTSTPKGANLAVAPPGFIFATGTNTTLALLNTNGVLVHYSVSYIKESA